MQVPLKDTSGKVVRKIEVSDHLFGLPITQSLLGTIHQVAVGQRANARRGTASTKTRGQVTGSTRKLFAQKGTGRARAGGVRSPIRRGGGTAFGPHPRSYRQRIPKKMRRLALRGALSSKVAEERLVVVEDLAMKEPKTKDMLQSLASLGVTSSALVVTPEVKETVVKSAHNLQGIKTLPAPFLNVLDLLTYDLLIMELAAVRKTEELWAPGGPSADDIQPEQPKEPAKRKKPAAQKKAPTTSKAKVPSTKTTTRRRKTSSGTS